MWRDVVNIIGLIGTFTGLGFTLWQVWGVKRQVQEAANAAELRVRNVMDLSIISKSIKVIESIQNHVRNKKWDLALVQMQELQTVLLSISEDKRLLQFARKNFNDCLMTMPSNMSILNELCQDKGNDDLRSFFSDMQDIRDNLTVIETHLK